VVPTVLAGPAADRPGADHREAVLVEGVRLGAARGLAPVVGRPSLAPDRAADPAAAGRTEGRAAADRTGAQAAAGDSRILPSVELIGCSLRVGRITPHGGSPAESPPCRSVQDRSAVHAWTMRRDYCPGANSA